MALVQSPSIVRNGLVFYYDMANTKKSWKGKPTTNLYTNGHFASGNHVTQAANGAYSNPVNEVIALKNPGNSDYCLRSTAVGGSPYTEYEMIASGLQPNTTYCMSCWYAKSPDWNGNDSVFHSRWWNADGSEQSTVGGGTGTTVETKVVGGLTWNRIYQTFSTGATVSGSHSWYAGYPSQNTAGYRYFTDFQLEVGSTPTPFADGVRSTSQAILDLTGNSTITANSLTYSLDGTFRFDGGQHMSIPNSNYFNMTTALSIETWVKFDSDSDDFIFEKGDVNTQYSLFSHGTDIVFRTYHSGDGGYHTQDPSKASAGISNGSWVHIIASWDGSYKRIYVNGDLKNEVSKSGALVTTSKGASVGRFGGDTTGYYFNGMIAKIAVYNIGLTEAQVKQNFNAQRDRYGV